jgi:hypothetical protein
MHETDEQCIQSLVEKPEGKKPYGGPMHSWKNNTETVLKKLGRRVWTGIN